MNRIVLMLLCVALWAGSAGAGIVSNSGSTAEDSLSIDMWLADSLGNPVVIDTTLDSGWITVTNGNGDSVYSDAFAIAQTEGAIEIYTIAPFGDIKFVYKKDIATLDGSAALEGTHNVTIYLRDSSLSLWTPYSAEFQLYATAALSTQLDLITTIEGQTDDIGAAGVGLTAVSIATGGIDSADIDEAAYRHIASSTSDTVWDEPLTGATHNLPTSAGRRLRQASEATPVLNEGTAQAGGDFTITLDSDVEAPGYVDDIFHDAYVSILAGIGIGQIRAIIDYDSATQVATVSEQWAVNPDATTEYVLSGSASSDLHSINEDTLPALYLSIVYADTGMATLRDSTLSAIDYTNNPNAVLRLTGDGDQDVDFNNFSIDGGMAVYNASGNALNLQSDAGVGLYSQGTTRGIQGQGVGNGTGLEFVGQGTGSGAVIQGGTSSGSVGLQIGSGGADSSGVLILGGVTSGNAVTFWNNASTPEFLAGDIESNVTDTVNAILDTFQVHAPHDNNFGAQWYGTGLKAVTLHFIDTSAVPDDTVMYTNFLILNEAMTQNKASGVADVSPGKKTVALDSTTTYAPIAAATGYQFPVTNFTTGDGNLGEDIAIEGYAISTSATYSSSEGTTLTGYATAGEDTLAYARVEITLAGGMAAFTTNDLVPMMTWVTYADANGKWEQWIYGNDSLQVVGGFETTYTVEYKHGDLKQEVEYENLTIPAKAAGAATWLRDIIADQ